ncbi:MULTISPECIES: ABC transporter ATP-binding protein [unclassified Streptomyces]|uniref:ABC transporter ATP-binding protein n=1 Tax=unclassified Streptomyces TaxID=2593676 RepID=UPI001F5B1F96|nr:ABC transporter ATP-binding protein [Streptomyces sp. HSG2]
MNRPAPEPIAATAPPDARAGTRSASVWRMAGAHRTLLVVGTLIGVIGVSAGLAQPYVIGLLVRSAGLGESLAWPVTVLCLLFLADAVFSSLQAYLIGRAGENIVRDVRGMLSGRLLRARLAAFTTHPQGDVQTRMVTDTSLVRIALSQSLAQLTINGFMTIGGVVLMFIIDPWLMLITLGCLAVASVVALLIARRLRHAALRNREDTGDFGIGIQRVLSALPTVKAARAEGREQERLAELAARARHSGVRVGALNALMAPAMNVGLQASLAITVAVGMTRVAGGGMELADLTAFIMYLFYMVSPLVVVFISIGQFQQGRAAVQRVTELAEIPQEPDPVATRPAPADLDRHHDPAVRFDDVSFGYAGPDGPQALSRASFAIPARGLSAIVGPSGAGKSTLFHLIERFYEPTSGRIELAGQALDSLSLEALRSHIGYVQQDTAAMSGTIRENLVYAHPEATPSQIDEAVRKAQLADVVAALPEGLETQLGDQGAGLSGGERQRLSIARAFLQHPSVLLLDEVTSHLDARSESALRDVLGELSRECAIVAIAHRLSTVVAADQILVLSEGRVRATGTHRELLAADSLYRELAGTQFGEQSDHASPEGPGR